MTDNRPVTRATVRVMHRNYGCDTGCCGHIVEMDGKRVGDFTFDHPRRASEARAWAETFLRKTLGADHVADLDWENSEVLCD